MIRIIRKWLASRRLAKHQAQNRALYETQRYAANRAAQVKSKPDRRTRVDARIERIRQRWAKYESMREGVRG